MANTFSEQVATTTQFDGTDGSGLVDFDTLLGGGISRHQNVVIYTIGFTPGAGTSAWTIDLVHPSGAASGNVNIQDGSGTEYTLTDARIVVPASSTLVPFELQVTTTGKTGDGHLTVVWGVEALAG